MVARAMAREAGAIQPGPPARVRCAISVTVTVLLTSPPRNPVTAIPRGPAALRRT
jgi:hypothetical protein